MAACRTSRLLPASAGNDAALVNQITDLINRVYTEAEAGLWVDGATRTSASEVAGQIRAGLIAEARMHGQIVGSVRIQRLATGEGEFGALAAAPERRGGDIGKQLVAFAEQQCRFPGWRRPRTRRRESGSPTTRRRLGRCWP